MRGSCSSCESFSKIQPSVLVWELFQPDRVKSLSCQLGPGPASVTRLGMMMIFRLYSTRKMTVQNPSATLHLEGYLCPYNVILICLQVLTEFLSSVINKLWGFKDAKKSFESTKFNPPHVRWGLKLWRFLQYEDEMLKLMFYILLSSFIKVI